MPGSARTVLGTVVAILAAAALADSAPAAGRIDSISPAVADRGDLVTITGKGFGARNVTISVDGRAAQVVAATGHKATFRVPALAGPGATTVKATNPGGHSGTIALRVRFDGVSTPVLDTPRRVSATVGRSGGSLASGGLTLTIPAGALSEDTTIALTPIRDLADSPLAGRMIGGAKLEPEGLIFLAPAALTIALPTGVAPSEVLGFGSAGDGSELHLQPRTVAGGTVSLRLRHFSTAGAAAGGAAAAAAMQAHQPSAAEQQALQRIAAAEQACQAELAAGVFSGPACADVRPEGVRALFDWYLNAVRPGLQAAGSAPSFVAEKSLADWLSWEAEVRLLFLNDPPPACGTLQNECEVAHGLATAAVGAHAQRRLDNCTGTSLAAQLRDVVRIADFAGAGALDLTSLNPPLPSATNGDLLHKCAHLEIEVTSFPEIAALFHANTLRGRVTVDVNTGPDRTDVPFRLTVDGALVGTAPDGTFQTTLTPATPGLRLNVPLEAEATTPSLQGPHFSASRDLIRDTRERLLLTAQGPTTVPAGGTLGLLVLVAGDGMTDPVTLTVGGPGSVGPTPVTPNARGEAIVVYTAPGSTVNPNAQAIATLLDGTSATVAITVAVVVTVGLDPTAATLAAGGTQNFTAALTNSLLGVTWSATGGSIVSTGSTTARYQAGSTAGTFSVTATSISDPTKSASATISIQAPTAGRVQLLARGGNARANAYACGLIGPFEGGLFLPIDDTGSDGERASDTSLASYLVEASAAVSAGEAFVSRGEGSASAQLDLTTTPARLLAFAAGQAQATSTASGADPCVRGSGRASVSTDITFDVSVASVPYSLDMFLAADPGNECNLSFRRLLPTPLTLAAGSSDVSTSGTLSPGRYQLEVDCEANSSSPGGNPAGNAGYLGQLDVGG